jgi:hypothetical protein
MKRKIDQVGGHDPWDIEIAYWINHRGIDPDLAHTFGKKTAATSRYGSGVLLIYFFC